MIFDTFIYGGEEKMLELRLKTLNDVVDHFVIVESTSTHSGKKNTPTFDLQDQKWGIWKDKIIYDIAEISPGSKKLSWQRENQHRNTISKILNNQLLSTDIIFVSDVDEIWNPNSIEFTTSAIKKFQYVVYTQNLYMFAINLQVEWKWNGPVGTQGHLLDPQYLRDIRNQLPFLPVDFGWHFSWIGEDQHKVKAKKTAHVEGTKKFNARKSFREEKIYGFSRVGIPEGQPLQKVEIDHTYPQPILNGDFVVPPDWIR